MNETEWKKVCEKSDEYETQITNTEKSDSEQIRSYELSDRPYELTNMPTIGNFKTEEEKIITEINQLWYAGKHEEAKAALAFFNELYPDYPREELSKKIKVQP